MYSFSLSFGHNIYFIYQKDIFFVLHATPRTFIQRENDFLISCNIGQIHMHSILVWCTREKKAHNQRRFQSIRLFIFSFFLLFFFNFSFNSFVIIWLVLITFGFSMPLQCTVFFSITNFCVTSALLQYSCKVLSTNFTQQKCFSLSCSFSLFLSLPSMSFGFSFTVFHSVVIKWLNFECFLFSRNFSPQFFNRSA